MFPYILHVARKERCFGAVSLLLILHHVLSQKEKVKMLVAYLCLTLCDPMDCGLPGSSVHRILQARILEWVAIPFSRGFPNQGSNPCLQHCRHSRSSYRIRCHLSHQPCNALLEIGLHEAGAAKHLPITAWAAHSQ